MVHRPVGVPHRRPEHPAVRLDLFLDERIPIVGDRQKAAKLFFRVIDKDRGQYLAVVGDEDWPVVGQELGAMASTNSTRKIQSDQ